jgi:MFS family permease
MSCVFGTLSLIFVFLPWITKAYHYESVYNGYILISANLAGCLGCVMVGVFGKTLSYRRKCILLLGPPIIIFGFLWLSFEF